MSYKNGLAALNLEMPEIAPRAFSEFVNRYTDWIQQYFNTLAKCTQALCWRLQSYTH